LNPIAGRSYPQSKNGVKAKQSQDRTRSTDESGCSDDTLVTALSIHFHEDIDANDIAEFSLILVKV